MYQAVIAPIKVRPHPNADKLAIGLVCNYQIVIARDSYADGDLVIFFPEGGCLTHEVAFHNNLYRKDKGVNKLPETYGYFDKDLRIRQIRLRGVVSEGFALPLVALADIGDVTQLKAGDQLNVFNGIEICKKYETPATAIAKQILAKASTQVKEVKEFAKIGDTANLRMMIDQIPVGSVIYITEKIHGTSGRTGLIMTDVPADPLPWWKKAWNYVTGTKAASTKRSYLNVSGTRNTICARSWAQPVIRPDGTEVPLTFRQEIHNDVSAVLKEGEVWYYEIVWVNSAGTSDFVQKLDLNDPEHKKLAKVFGTSMNYRYKTAPGQWRMWVYKVTQQNEQGHVVTLTYPQMAARVSSLGYQPVPLVTTLVYDGNAEALKELLIRLDKGTSTIDPSHICEGWVLEVVHQLMHRVLKYKLAWFCELEGISKNDPNLVDPEEIA
jgi:hypothetical protein